MRSNKDEPTVTERNPADGIHDCNNVTGVSLVFALFAGRQDSYPRSRVECRVWRVRVEDCKMSVTIRRKDKGVM